jgi:NADH:ubiquinone oxidoreductase subunit 5 (subunit L)/multisubunit Na+/H+ antiporter MnhA subunit
MAISGIPPLNGFASKWMVYQGIVETGKAGGHLWIVWLAAAMLGSALTLASFVKVLHAGFLRKASPEVARKPVREVGFSMWAPTTVLAALCVLFGVFVHRLPLAHLIGPAVGDGILFTGDWWAGPATVMLLVGIIAGFVIYFITSASKVRVCDTYVGGEVLSETYITDVGRGGGRDVEVTGVDFYASIKAMPLIRTMYKGAEKKLFDIYDVVRETMFYFVKVLRSMHAGLLPMYLTWLVLGLLIIFYVLMKG